MRRTLAALLAVAAVALGLAACQPVDQTPPIRAAFYYPWFPETWGTGAPFTNYTPTRGFYDTNAVVKAHVADMQYAGLTAGIASWWGQGSPTDQRMPNLLAAAAGTTFQWAPYDERESTGDPTVAQLTADLNYLAAQYADDPGFLHVGGKPVIFAFADGNDRCAMADRWAAANAAASTRFYVDLKVFPGYTACAHQPDSWHQYGPSTAADRQAGYSYSVSPGFWKKGETAPRLTRDPARFQANVQAMVASNEPWQLLTTYNEWGEGTAVEGSTTWNRTYLDILHNVIGGTTSTSTSSPPASTTTNAPSSTTSTVPTGSAVCGNAGSAALHQKVVVFSFENRTWSSVGGTQFGSVPYFHQLATTGKCPTFASYTEPDTGQNSATQYVGTWAGSTANTVRSDCSPSASCESTQDNIARQARAAGLTARSYVEGATATCSAGGNAAKHVPALYFRAAADAAACATEVRPYSQFDPNNLADFSFVTPTLCNDGHDCGNSTVSAWAAKNVQPVLDSVAYRAGQVTVQIFYDEDRPVPNLFLGTHALPGVKSTPIDYGSTLRLWESELGLPFIAHAASATDLRPLAGI